MKLNQSLGVGPNCCGSMGMSYLVFWTAMLITFLSTPSNVASVELTFELPDNAKECFHEDIQKGVQTTFEFQA